MHLLTRHPPTPGRTLDVTTHRPADRTPAGAYLNVRRRSRWSSIQIDRWPITDASPQQARTATALVVRR